VPICILKAVRRLAIGGEAGEKRRSKVSDNKVDSKGSRYGVQVDWTTVVPVGDTLAVNATEGFDDRWVKAFEVVLDEHEREDTEWHWGEIDFEYASGDQSLFVLFVKRIRPEAKSFELRRTVDGLVRSSNTVAQVGTHVYELAQELRGPVNGNESTPPPSLDPLADELRIDAA
jgi:hypothetical protein